MNGFSTTEAGRDRATIENDRQIEADRDKSQENNANRRKLEDRGDTGSSFVAAMTEGIGSAGARGVDRRDERRKVGIPLVSNAKTKTKKK